MMRTLLHIFTLSAAVLIFGSATALADTTDGNAHKIKYPAPKNYIYRFTFTDKHGTGYRIDKPEEFLSKESINRRFRQGLSIDSTDLPVSYKYIYKLNTPKSTVVGTSKWNNTAIVHTSDTSIISRLAVLPFVKKCEVVWISPDSIIPSTIKTRYHREFREWDSVATSDYATAAGQIRMLNGIRLHDIGMRGKGITIAVLDGGFLNADKIPVFMNANIAGSQDFVYPKSADMFSETDHGTRVLSTMAVDKPHFYVGTAPDATYWLLRCEDQQSEQPVEEDYWAMAAEFADSVGADIVSSSLGYNDFDKPHHDHTYAEMDGHSTLISNTASMLAGKGIVMVSSAGNTGMGPWKKITFPADADDILTVGAGTETHTNAPFSGIGPTQDGRVKPDVMALGSPAALISGRGTILTDIGTSFATPIISGMIACLWQALPSKSAKEIISLVRQSGDNCGMPNNIMGYGIPNFWDAYLMGAESASPK